MSETGDGIEAIIVHFESRSWAMLHRYAPYATTERGGLGLEDEIFDFSPAAVLFGELDAKLPAVIRGSQE